MPARPEDLDGARERLATRQAALLAALVGAGPVPAGLDAGRVAVQAEALLAKRRRVAQRAWPELAAALGPDFAGAFDAYARATPRRGTASGSADAVAFAEHLRRAGRLPGGLRVPTRRARLRRR